MAARRHEKKDSDYMPDGDSIGGKIDSRDELSLGGDIPSIIREIALDPKGKKLLNEYLTGAISDLNEIQRIQIMFISSLQQVLETDSYSDFSMHDASLRSISSGTTTPSEISGIEFTNSAVSESLESFFSARSSSSSSCPYRNSTEDISRQSTEAFIDRYKALTDLFYQFSEQSFSDDLSSFSSISTDHKKHIKRKHRKR